MPNAINSFDVFDTLIARRRVDPRRVLDLLETRGGIAGLAAARLAADQSLCARGQPFKLHDLWHEVGRTMGLDETTIEQLMQLEVQLEHEEVIPVTENLAKVRDGDVLVSDTYLPVEIVRTLLQRVGLEKQVALVTSNDGKFRGWIWPKLLSQTCILQHLGDNPQSDGRSPTTAGMKAVIYSGAARTRVERFLVESGWISLADLVREVRLANPFPEARAQERHLWWMACQLNFPLLVFASLLLERYVQEQAIREVFFVSRDCLMWQRLYRQLFPQRQTTYFYASRLCLIKPSESYVEYFRGTWHRDGVIVDLSSTGASWSKMFARLNVKARCWFIEHIDNFSYLPDASRPEDWLEMTSVFRDSEMAPHVNKGVEMLNYAPHGRVEDVVMLPEGAALAMLADSVEYDPALPTAAHNSFRACVDALRHFPDLSRADTATLGRLIREFVRHICADRKLPAIYSGHHAADVAYERRLLGH